ncbi:hypothetical protein [Streptomonospora arabica]|uniref:HTH merR-type domain-containing protein n=1 Tax=Streptomonospora arabica TaxID=412417 RepID=A0ABV9SSL9_9ACTN
MSSNNTTGTPCHLCGRPSGDDAYACTTCAETLRDALREITGEDLPHGLADDLDTALAKQGTKPERDGARTKASEVPLPIDVRASEAAGVLRNTLATWVRVVHEDQPKPLPVDALPAMAGWLLPLCGWLRGRDYGPECIDEITHAVQQARRAVDIPAVSVYVGPCECGAAVYARTGSPLGTCRECGAQWGVAEQREWMRNAAEDTLMTAAEIARATSRPSALVSPGTVRSWASRGRLEAHGHNERKHPLYRLGDALNLLAPEGQIAS